MVTDKERSKNSVAEETDAEVASSDPKPRPHTGANEATTTVQLRRSTRDRLAALKAPGLTYDDVVNLALDNFPEEEFYSLFEEWQADAAAKLLDDPSMIEAKVSKDSK